LRSIAHGFSEDRLHALVYDLSITPKMIFPWPGTEHDFGGGQFVAEKASLLLLLGFIPRIGTPNFAYKTSREIEVI
jgi:hypothetical protein